MQIVLYGRAQIGRVVVGDEKVRDQLAPRAGVGLREPAPDHGAAVAARQTLQLLLERCGLLQKMPVFLDQKAHALGRGHLETQTLALAHAVEELSRHLQLADLLAFRFDEYGARGIETLQRAPHQAVEHLLRRLRLARKLAEQRAAVAGEALQIEHLRALCRERGEQAALAAPGGAAHRPEPETLRRLIELRHDFATVRAVAAFERRRVPADLAQHVGHRRGALPAAPAIDEGAPAL